MVIQREAGKEELEDDNEVDLELMAWCRSEAGMTQLPSSVGNESNVAVNDHSRPYSSETDKSRLSDAEPVILAYP